MINGVINVYKEKGYTSFDVVAKLRGILHQKKIGHTGTLDPDAEGVLPVCLGKATRLVDMLTSETKTYEAVLLLGVDTDTQDVSGSVLSSHPVTCTQEELGDCLRSFAGDQLQIPPMYSALKVHGRRLYEIAREGKTVEREARPVHFYEIKMLSCQLPKAVIRVTCSRGTYIRTLCHDIGERLGCGGCMEALTRTRVGMFCMEDALHLDEIRQKTEDGRLGDILIPVDQLFAIPSLETLPQADSAAHNGNRISASCCREKKAEHLPEISGSSAGISFGSSGDTTEKVKIFDSEGAFVGIFERDDAGSAWKPVRMFYDPGV
ncbi:MAG: tRNA pseudouridine(55) synthase TruB [Eubacterium sp.]|nr:tRNA pseudouridine(55) synthase TruB [Eubacterium sp.]